MKKKILHIAIANYFGGVTKVIKNICTEFANDEEIEIVLVVTKESEKFFHDILGVKLVIINYLNIIEFIKEIIKIIRENRIEIVHSNDNKTSLICYLIKKLKKADFKLISHVHSCDKWLERRTIKKYLNIYFRNKYDLNIFCGKKVLEFYKKNLLNLDEKKCKVLSNSVKILEKQLYKTKKSNYLYMGRLSEEKGIFDLIKILHCSIEKIKNSRVLIVGTGPLEKSIKEYIRDNKLEDYFILEGFQYDVEKYYRLSEILIVPSHTEALPMSILEAMANNVIVLSMNVGSISEVVKNNETGYLIEAEDYKGFVEKMIDLKDKKENDLIKEKAHFLIETNYNLSIYIKKLKEIYLNL